MWIGVFDLAFTHQHATFLQQVNDRVIGLEHSEPVIVSEAVVDAACLINVAGLIQLIANAGIEVVGAMRRSRVNRAGTLLGSDVLGQDPENTAIKKRMCERCIFQYLSRKASHCLCVLQIRIFACCRFERGRDYVNLSILLQSDIFKLGMKCDSHGGGKRPRSCGPDDCIHLLAGECRIDLLRRAGQLILHIDTGTRMLCILNFCLGEGGLINNAPINRTQSFVNEAVFNEIKECADDDRLVLL